MEQNMQHGNHPEGDRSWIWKRINIIVESDMTLFTITVLILALSVGLYWEVIPGWVTSILLLVLFILTWTWTKTNYTYKGHILKAKMLFISICLIITIPLLAGKLSAIRENYTMDGNSVQKYATASTILNILMCLCTFPVIIKTIIHMLENEGEKKTYICCNDPNIFWNLCCCHCDDDEEEEGLDNEIKCCNKPYVWIHFGLIILIMVGIIICGYKSDKNSIEYLGFSTGALYLLFISWQDVKIIRKFQIFIWPLTYMLPILNIVVSIFFIAMPESGFINLFPFNADGTTGFLAKSKIAFLIVIFFLCYTAFVCFVKNQITNQHKLYQRNAVEV